MADNWYIILGLELVDKFDANAGKDWEFIESRLIEKRKEWTGNTNKDLKAKNNLEKTKDPRVVENAMRDPVSRKALLDEAIRKRNQKIDTRLNTVAKGKEFTQDTLERIAIRLSREDSTITLEVVTNRAKALGIKIDTAKAVKTTNYDAIYEKHYKKLPAYHKNARSQIDNLKILMVNNYYEFLNLGLPEDKKSYGLNVPYKTLLERAGKVKGDYRKTDARSTAGTQLSNASEIVFKSESSKKEYDDYLEFMQGKILLDEAREIAEYSGGSIGAQQFDHYVKELTRVYKDRKLATEVLTAICEIESIRYPKAEADDDKQAANLVVCGICGITNDVKDGRKVCQSCGTDLYIKCPKCGIINESNVKVCKCKFRLDNINKAIALCDLAETAIDQMDFVIAETHLADAEKLWQGYNRVNEVREKLNARQKRVGDTARSLKEAFSDKRFFEARTLYSNIQKQFPDYKEEALETEINTAVEAAGAEFKKAKAAKTEAEIIKHCELAIAFCKDYPGVMQLIPAPQPPGNLKITPGSSVRALVMSWDKTRSEGTILYHVVRKKDAAPINEQDGDLLGKVSSCSFSDTKIEAATAYYYAIFAERAAAISKPLINAVPALVLFEASNLTLTAGDSQLDFRWDALSAGGTVEIYRKSSAGRDEKIHSTSLTGYLDKNLKNDTKYDYTVKVVYNVAGNQQATNGVQISGIPTVPLNPVKTLTIKPEDGDNYTASWSNPDNADVVLYCSTERPPYEYRDVVSQQALEKVMRRLAVNNAAKTSASFEHKGDEPLFIIAAAEKSGSVVIGAMARAHKGGAVKINSVMPVNGKIHIAIDIPKNATGFLVIYRFDRFHDDITVNHPDAKRISFMLRQYEHHNALVIDSLEQKEYYFTVYASYKADGDIEYSAGTDFLFSNAAKEVITYSISVSKKMFGGSSVVLGFEAENKTFILPDIEVMSNTGSAPVFKASSTLLYEIGSQPVTGRADISVPLPKVLPRNTFIKAFLKDEALNSAYQLKLKVKSGYKIS
jgi:hypothetical protein